MQAGGTALWKGRTAVTVHWVQCLAVNLWSSGSQTSTRDDAEPRPLLQDICSVHYLVPEHLRISFLTWAIACGPSRYPSKPAAFRYQRASCPESPSSASQVALEHFFCLSSTRLPFQASHRHSRPAVAYQAVLALPNYDLKLVVGTLWVPNSIAQQGKMPPLSWSAWGKDVGLGKMHAQLPAPLGFELGGSREQLHGCSSFPVLLGPLEISVWYLWHL